MAKTIKVLVLPTGKPAEVREIASGLEAMQAVVGGYIEAVAINEHVTLWCNEEGKLTGLPLNLRAPSDPMFPHDIIAGDCFLTRIGSNGETKSLTEKDIKTFTEKFGLVGDTQKALRFLGIGG